MDGIDCVQRLRIWEQQQPSRSRLYTIAYTANGDDPGVRMQCIAAGFDVVVNKPVYMVELRSLLLGE